MAYTGFQINEGQKKEVKSIKYPTFDDFPTTGQNDKYYKSLDDKKVFKWNGTVYLEINPALDNNGQLVSITANPQGKRDTPLTSDVYRVLNISSCPIDPSDEVYLTMSGYYLGVPDNKFTITAALSNVLSNDLLVDFSFTFKDDGFTKYGGSHGVAVTSGQPEGTVEIPNDVTLGTVTDIQITVVSVNPNPNGGKTIIY